MQNKYKRTVMIILLFVFVVYLQNSIFSEAITIDGLNTSVGGIIQCNYDSQTNNCSFDSIDSNYYINGTKTISVPNKNPNLIIPANITLIIKDGSDNAPKIIFQNFNSIIINENKSLTIINNSLSSIDVYFVNVPFIKINTNSKLVIKDDDLKNLSAILKNDLSYRYNSAEAKTEPKIIKLHSGNIDFSNTKMYNNGELDININRTIILSAPISSVDYSSSESSCMDNLNNYGGGLIFPKPAEEDDEDDSSEEIEENYFCYKYLDLNSCNLNYSESYYYPKANDINSTYLCFDILKSPKNIIFKDINSSQQSNISIFSKISIKKNIAENKMYYLDDDSQNTYISFPEDQEGPDPEINQSDFIFNEYTGRVPQILNNNRNGSILFQTCGPIVLNPNNLYNACKFIYLRPDDLGVDFNSTNTGNTNNKVLHYIKKNKNCNFENMEDALSNYYLVDSNQDITPFIFGQIITQNTGESINPSFTNQGFFDINISESYISAINNTLNNNFFIYYLDPSKKKELNIIQFYQFKFKLNANSDLNYSDINLYYPLKLYK